MAGPISTPRPCAYDKKCLFFQDVQMILLPHFDIPYGFGLGKIP